MNNDIIKNIEKFICQEVSSNQTKGISIALSGGIDSTTVAYLSCNAVGNDNVYAIMMPVEGRTDTKETEDAVFIAEYLGIDYMIKDIFPIISAYQNFYRDKPRFKEIESSLISRTRIAVQRTHADENELLIAGCGNKSEYLLGLFIKGGAGAGDIFPIEDFYKTEVFQIADCLKIPDKILQKEPSDGFLGGSTDEKFLGGSYERIDPILFLLHEENKTPKETTELLDENYDYVNFINESYIESKRRRNYSVFQNKNKRVTKELLNIKNF